MFCLQRQIRDVRMTIVALLLLLSCKGKDTVPGKLQVPPQHRPDAGAPVRAEEDFTSEDFFLEAAVCKSRCTGYSYCDEGPRGGWVCRHKCDSDTDCLRGEGCVVVIGEGGRPPASYFAVDRPRRHMRR